MSDEQPIQSNSLNEITKWAKLQAARFALDAPMTAKLVEIIVEGWRKGFHKGTKATLWAVKDFVLTTNKKQFSNQQAGRKVPDSEL